MPFAGHIADGILLLFLQSLDHGLRHVDECDLVPGLAERRADKAAADVAAAVHNCLFHSDSDPLFLFLAVQLVQLQTSSFVFTPSGRADLAEGGRRAASAELQRLRQRHIRLRRVQNTRAERIARADRCP